MQAGAILLMAVAFCVVAYITGCQDTNFSALTTTNCESIAHVEGLESCGGMQVSEDAGGVSGLGPDEEWEEDEYEEEEGGGSRGRSGDTTQFKVRLGKINVLFVVDNSSSMEQELKSVADQFDDFLDSLDNMDYRIALMTMDEEEKGEFVDFSRGEFLENPERAGSVHEDNVEDFKDTLKELAEEQGARHERGIYVVNQALDKAGYGGGVGGGFFRPHSLLMIIFISDENEYSYGGYCPRTFTSCGSAPRDGLPEEDRPGTLFQRVNTVHSGLVTLVNHAIVVTPGDESCRRKQGENRIPEQDGSVYAKAAHPERRALNRYGNLKKGKVISICDQNYSDQLGSIADYVSRQGHVLTTHCVPVPESVRLRVDGDRVDFSLSGRQISIEETVSFGADARLRYRCLSNRS